MIIEMLIGSITMMSTLVIAFTIRKNLDPPWIQVFAWFTLLEFVIQFIGYFYVKLTHIRDNIFIFNINIFIEYGFYLWIIYKAIISPRLKKAVLWLLVFFCLIYAYQLYSVPLLIKGSTYYALMGNLGGIFTLLACFVFFSELMVQEMQINFTRMPLFYMNTGIMIEVVGVFIYLAFRSYINKYHLDPDGSIYGVIMTVCSLLQYGFFSIGFLAVNKWIRKKF